MKDVNRSSSPRPPRTICYVLLPWGIYLPTILMARYTDFGKEMLETDVRQPTFGAIAALFVVSSFDWAYSMESYKGARGTERLRNTLVNGFFLSVLHLTLALLLFVCLLVSQLRFWPS